MSDQTKKPVYINRENFTDKIKSYLFELSCEKRRIVCFAWSKWCREKYNHFYSLWTAEKIQDWWTVYGVYTGRL